MTLGPLDSFWLGSILVIVLTGIYTVPGGLRAVAYTEALQTFVLVFGSAMVAWFGLCVANSYYSHNFGIILQAYLVMPNPLVTLPA